MEGPKSLRPPVQHLGSSCNFSPPLVCAGAWEGADGDRLLAGGEGCGAAGERWPGLPLVPVPCRARRGSRSTGAAVRGLFGPGAACSVA